MKITIMGCGGSAGVPTITGQWGECDPNNPKNRRTRSAICVDGDAGERIIVDTGPDFREQFLRLRKHDRLDAVLYTHAHSDHIAGIADLCPIFHEMRKEINIYGHDTTMRELINRFSFLFEGAEPIKFYPPVLMPHVIDKYTEFNSISVISFDQIHGSGISTGYRFNNFAYSTDVGEIPEESFQALKGIKTWVIGTTHVKNTNLHADIDRIQKWCERVKPDKVFLTHLGHYLDYDALCNVLPSHIKPAYDGLEIEEV